MKMAMWLRGLLLAVVCVASTSQATDAGELHQRFIQRHYSWNYNYYDPAWGASPHALVSPPNAKRHTEYNWGVCGNETTRINHQFIGGMRSLPGAYGSPVYPAPVQPSSTNQMGVYYIRAPR
jgi:hypothetical protein